VRSKFFPSWHGAGEEHNKMKQLEIYVHTRGSADPKLVKTGEDAAVDQLIEQIAVAAGLPKNPDQKLVLFLEDGDEPLEHHRKLCECEIRHRHHVHCHHCNSIKVSVFYNREKHAAFPPSAKVERVLDWAVNEFKLTPAEAADKFLTLKGKDEELPLDAHIGSFADDHGCAVSLCLTAPVEVNG
jgi:hypothetical protein